MKVIEVDNVHAALPVGLDYLRKEGSLRESRNGAVIVAPGPVTTVYRFPCQRVLFWPERDANPFFHLFEALWMLAGRDDVESVARFASNMRNYSDDGFIFHGAYGARWRRVLGQDQLPIIAENLKRDAHDRRSVLQMWDQEYDLGRQGKDLPCNLTATFQRAHDGSLDLTVFCRSNDIIWGAYGANAVHFSVLLEYMANWIGCEVGVYRQVSVNYHAYVEPFKKLSDIRLDRVGYAYQPYHHLDNRVRPLFLPPSEVLDARLPEFLQNIEDGLYELNDSDVFFRVLYTLFRAHDMWKTFDAPERFSQPLMLLRSLDYIQEEKRYDWVVAAREWLLRRELAWVEKNA